MTEKQPQTINLDAMMKGKNRAARRAVWKKFWKAFVAQEQVKK